MVDYQTISFAVLAVASIYVTSEAIAYRKRAAFCAKHGCKPPPTDPGKWYFFGVDNIVRWGTWTKKRIWLEGITKTFKSTGSRTFSINLVGLPEMLTMSPENLKIMLATNADDFQAGTVCINGMKPYSMLFL